MHTLRQRMGACLKRISPVSGTGVDEAETTMRWMTLMRWRLLLQLGGALRTAVEMWAHRPVEELSTPVQRSLIHLGTHAMLRVLELQRPDEWHRMESRAHGAVDRALAEVPPLRRDLASAAPASVVLVPLRGLEHWGELLPDPRWLARRSSLNEASATLVTLRYGLGGQRPWTLREIAEARGCTVAAVARQWDHAARSLKRSG